jgi:methyl-accepting chemotaxis protein
MLLFQIGAAADTLIVRQLPPVRSTFEQIVFVASGITSILLLGLLVVVLMGMVALRNKTEDLRQKVDDLIADLRPMATSATATAEEVREVAAKLNTMVDDSRDTVRVVNSRVRKSTRVMATRVNELSELIGRISRSAERVSAIAGTAMGGLKFGARALGLGRKKKSRKAREKGERPRLRRRV